MSYADLIRDGIALAHAQVDDGELTEQVMLYRWISDDSYGKPTYAPPLKLRALVEHSAKRIRTDGGAETVATAVVTVLKPFKELSGVTGREEPVDKRDKVLLPTGKSGPILRTDNGLTDPSTERPFMVQIYLG